MRVRFLLMGLVLMGVGVQVQAQSCSKPAGSYSLLGGVVVDKANKLAWQRCSVGQSWNGSSCAGSATGYYFSQATALPVPPGNNGFQWQLPSPAALKSLVLGDASCSPEIDQVAFPQTAASYYWTSQPLQAPGINNAYCRYFGGSVAGVDNCFANNGFYVRFVSALPPNYTDPVAPTSIGFSMDDTGSYLLVGGSGFSANPADNQVNFPSATGSISVTPETATETQLRVLIPDQATTGSLTVTTFGLTSKPSTSTLRLVNNNTGCTAAGFTASEVPFSKWQYCILQAPTGKTYADKSSDLLIIGASATALVQGQTSYTASTSFISHSTAATVALKSTVVIKYESSGLYGELLVNKTPTGDGPDTFVNQTGLHNFGVILNRGTFNNQGGLRNLVNGVVANSGTFNNQQDGKQLVLGTKGTALSSLFTPGASFMNVTESDSGPRATLNNSTPIVTLDGSIPGLLNDGGDVVNSGTLKLSSIQALVNKTGSLQPSVISNSGVINVLINPVLSKYVIENEANATINNLAKGSINNAAVSTAFLNNGVVTNCGSKSGTNPSPNTYAACPSGR